MKQLKYITHAIAVAVVSLVLLSGSCGQNNEPESVSTTNEIGDINITQAVNDKTVTLTITADRADNFTVDWDDESDAETVNPGVATTHTYADFGTYTVTVTANSANLDAKTATETVNVLDPGQVGLIEETIEKNGLDVSLSITSENADSFSVDWADESAVDKYAIADKASHTYSSFDTYEATITAEGEGFTSREKAVTITLESETDATVDIVNSPITFEQEAKYDIWETGVSTGSGGFANEELEGAVVDNPEKEGINTSDKVVQFTKKAGNAVWNGLYIDNDDSFKFSNTFDAIKVQVYSTVAGATLLLKAEVPGGSEGETSKEVAASQPVGSANEWVELEFNFSDVDKDRYWQRLTFIFNNGVEGAGQTFYIDSITASKADVTLVSATLPMTFDEAGVNYAGWTGFNGGQANTPIDNPSKTGVNTSDMVGSYTKNAGDNFAGVFFTLNDPIDFTENNTITAKVRGPEAGKRVALKVENKDNSKITSGNVFYTIQAADTWEEAEFVLSAIEDNQEYSKIVITYDLGTVGTGEVLYFDDLALKNTVIADRDMPTTAAPTPTRDAADVYNLYSDYYATGATNASPNQFQNLNLFPNWGQATKLTAIEVPSGNNVIEYSNLDFQGNEFSSTDLSSMTHLHLDIWVDDEYNIEVTPISLDPDMEDPTTLGDLTANSWNSIELPLSGFAGVDFTKIQQMKYQAAASGNENTKQPVNIYLDNIYFYDDGTGGVGVPLTKATLPFTFDDENTDYFTGWSGVNEATFDTVVNPGKSGINTTNSVGELTTGGNNTPIVQYLFDPALDVAIGDTIKMQFYGTANQVAQVNLAGTGVNETFSYTIQATNTWERATFVATEAGSYTNFQIQLDPGSAASGDKLYFDSIAISKPSAVTPPSPNAQLTGTFGRATRTAEELYTFPTGAEDWAGFANENTSLYPLTFPFGATITFMAALPAGSTIVDSSRVVFQFEANPHPNNNPNFRTDIITVTSATATQYTATIPAQVATQEFNSYLMYLIDRDRPVTITDVLVVPNSDPNAQFTGVFGGATRTADELYTFPMGAEDWAGFANENTSLYPFSFPLGGTITFDAELPTGSTIVDSSRVVFQFEANPHPNNNPNFRTNTVTVTTVSSTQYRVTIPDRPASETYNSFLLYLIDRDRPVTIRKVRVTAAK